LKESKREADRWLSQAENDLEFAIIGQREGFYSQVRFQCHQVCEKALKAVRFGAGERIVYGHSLTELAAAMTLSEELVDELAVIDQYYIPTRYLNGLPGGIPHETYKKR
jgi:HEPN domain-containing protein